MSVTWSVECDTASEAVASVLKLGPTRPDVLCKPKRRMTREEFIQFCADHPEVHCELLPDGTLELMSPLVLDSNENEWQPFVDLAIWYRRTRLGKIYSSTAGFTLPNGSIRSPGAAWLSPETVAGLSVADFKTMPLVVPDFVIEVMSKTDNLQKAKDKMSNTWMANGVKLGWLVRPSVTQVLVYRQGVVEPEKVKGFRRSLSADEVVPGFELDLRELL